MCNVLRDDGIIKFSRGAKQLAAAVSHALLEEPDLTVDALAERLSVSREELAVAFASANAVSSLDEPLSDGSGNRFDRIGSDAEEQKTTFMSLYGQERCEQEVHALTERAVQAVDRVFSIAEFLQALARSMETRRS